MGVGHFQSPAMQSERATSTAVDYYGWGVNSNAPDKQCTWKLPALPINTSEWGVHVTAGEAIAGGYY